MTFDGDFAVLDNSPERSDLSCDNLNAGQMLEDMSEFVRNENAKRKEFESNEHHSGITGEFGKPELLNDDLHKNGMQTADYKGGSNDLILADSGGDRSRDAGSGQLEPLAPLPKITVDKNGNRIFENDRYKYTQRPDSSALKEFKSGGKLEMNKYGDVTKMTTAQGKTYQFKQFKVLGEPVPYEVKMPDGMTWKSKNGHTFKIYDPNGKLIVKDAKYNFKVDTDGNFSWNRHPGGRNTVKINGDFCATNKSGEVVYYRDAQGRETALRKAGQSTRIELPGYKMLESNDGGKSWHMYQALTLPGHLPMVPRSFDFNVKPKINPADGSVTFQSKKGGRTTTIKLDGSEINAPARRKRR